MAFDERAVEVQALDVLTSQFTEKALTEFDGPPFFDARTGRALLSLDDVRLPIGFSWTGNWKIGMDVRGADMEGWVMDGRIRRRWWTRRRERIQSLAASNGGVPSLVAAASTTATQVEVPSLLSSSSSSSSALMTTTLNKMMLPEDLLRHATMALQLLSQIHSKLESAATIESVSEAVEQGSNCIKHAETALTLLEQAPGAPLAPRIKLSNDVSRASQKFNALADDVSTRVRFAKRNSTTRSRVPMSSSSPALQQQQQQQMLDHSQRLQEQEDQSNLRLAAIVSEVGLNEEIIRERTEELRDIHHKTVTINAMMKDLAVLVDGQGETVKQVVKNANDAHENVKAGLVQVQKTEAYQTEGGSCIVS